MFFLVATAKIGHNQFSEPPSPFDPPMVNSDGAVYLQVAYTRSEDNWSCPQGTPVIISTNENTLSLLRVLPSGEASWQTLKSFAEPSLVSVASPAEVIPDGSGGLLAAWTFGPFTGSQETRISRWTPSGATEYTLPLNGWMNPDISLVLGENGTAFATDLSQVLSFDLATGVVQWIWQPAQGPVEMIMSTAGNGLIAKNRDETTGLETVVRLDSSGTSRYEAWSKPSIQYAVSDLWLVHGSSAAISAAGVEWPNSVWPMSSQQSERDAERKIEVRVYKVNESNVDDNHIRDRVNTAIEYWQTKGILFSWNGIATGVPACDPLDTLCRPIDPEYINEVLDDAGLAAVVARFPNRKGINVVFVERINPNAEAVAIPLLAPPSPGQPSQPRELLEFLNIVLAPKDVINVIPHEFGHVFQLRHVFGSIRFTFNLMCGPTSPTDEKLSDLCILSRLTWFLQDWQVTDAKKHANKLKD